MCRRSKCASHQETHQSSREMQKKYTLKHKPGTATQHEFFSCCDFVHVSSHSWNWEHTLPGRDRSCLSSSKEHNLHRAYTEPTQSLRQPTQLEIWTGWVFYKANLDHFTRFSSHCSVSTSMALLMVLIWMEGPGLWCGEWKWILL